MENASKALLMAGAILIGILILTFMVTLFASSRDLTKEYQSNKESEAIQQFNVNFTKYLGQELTIHEVVTITNFANLNNVNVINGKTKDQIPIDLNDINNLLLSGAYKNKKVSYIYKLEIKAYTEEGYVSKISFSNRELKVTT